MKIYCASRDNSDEAFIRKAVGKDVWVKTGNVEESIFYSKDRQSWDLIKSFSWVKFLSILEPGSAAWKQCKSTFYTEPDDIFVRFNFLHDNPYVEYPRAMFESTYHEIITRYQILPISRFMFVHPFEMKSTDELFTIKGV